MRVRPHPAAVYRWLVLRQHLPIPTQVTRVLDVGCQDGYIARQIPAQLRLGVDLRPRLQPTAEIAVVQASAEALPLPNESFDCILACDVLEHIEHDRTTMHEMLRALTPGGVLVWSTPAQAFRMVPSFLTPYTNRRFGHVRNGYTLAQLRSLLPDPERWTVDYIYWNEPFFRMGFIPLHALNLVSHNLAVRATILCYQLDRLLHHGVRGHLFGVIRRRAA